MNQQPLSDHVGSHVLYEDDEVKVWLLELAPRQATDWHVHGCDYVFIVTRPGTVRCEYINGAAEDQVADALGSMQYRTRDVPHRLVNIGQVTYQNIVVELKATRPN